MTEKVRDSGSLMDDTEVVLTKNLTYGYVTLMPKDEREARIFY